MEGKFQNGLASRNGIMAGLLAEQGATDAETSFEGKAGFYQAFAGSTPDLSKLTGGLGSNFAIMQAEYKVFPVCALEQIPVNLALGLVEMNNIDAKTIANVTVVMPEAEYLYPGTNNPGPFTSRFQAIMSSQFCVAAALLRKPVRSHTFYDKGYADPEVTGLAHKIILVGEKGKNEISIEVALHDGNRFSAQGGKEDLLVPDFAKIRTKFENLAIEYLGTEGVDRVIQIVSDLDKIGDIGELTRHLSHT
jgi:2-methylcitrate dehydratase PrpD